MPKSNRQARAAPPAAYHGVQGRLGRTKAELVGAVVEMVRVAVPAVMPVMFTVPVEPKLNVGGYTAPVGLEVTAAARVTLPVKPPAGVTVTVEVFPLVAPGVTVTAVPAIAKEGVTAIVR